MRYIANIITSSNNYKFNDFIKICSSCSEMSANIPTLIVGLDNVKKCISEKPNYIIRELGGDMYWTFGVTEKRMENEKDILKFKKNIIKKLKKNIKYDFFNILTATKSKIKSFINFLHNGDEKYFFFTRNMLYISFDNRVIGVSLDDCEYIGINREKIYNRVKKNFEHITTYSGFLSEDDKLFFNNDNILLAAMFCYVNS